MVVVIGVYRPGGESVASEFFDELSAVLEQLAAYSCPVVVTGDLNLHIDVVGACNARRFQELMDTFGLQQSVTAPTHRDGHILDVLVTRSDLPNPAVEVRPWGELSPDHSLVLFQLPLPRPPLKFINFSTRAWRNFDTDKFRTDLLASRLCAPLVDPDGVYADWLQDTYDSTLSALLAHPKFRTVRRRHQPTIPWFDADCAAAK